FMALAILTIACLLSYATSRYFPIESLAFVQKRQKLSLTLSVAMALLALYIFTETYDFATALIVWLTAYMTILTSVIVSLKINAKSIWLWGGLCLVSIMLDLF
ncbi:MAG: hypothetical protein AAFN10_17080, partial [Bacteroidota bacterium]